MGTVIPVNAQLQELLNRAVNPNAISGVFDAILALKQHDQDAARKLFQSVAATNPAAAAFLLGQPGIAKSITETPKVIGGKGEPSPGQLLGEAAGRIPAPAAKSPIKGSTIAATQTSLLKLAEGFKKIGVNPPPDVWANVSAKMAAGQPYTADDFGVDGDTLFAAMAAAGEGSQGFVEKLFNAGISARGIDQIADPVQAQKAKEALYRELSGKLSPEAFTQLHDAQLDRLDQVIALGNLQTQMLQTTLTNRQTQPLDQAQLASVKVKQGTYDNAAKALIRVKGKLDAVAAGDKNAAQDIINESLAIPKSNDPFLESVKANVLQVLVTLQSVDDEKRAATAKTLKNQIDTLLQQVNSISSNYGAMVKSGSKKAPPISSTSAKGEDANSIYQEILQGLGEADSSDEEAGEQGATDEEEEED